VARTRADVLRCAQSVYSVTPVNAVLGVLPSEPGPLAYVGLPDQVASVRKLQRLGHPAVAGIRFVLGPYMGTQMHFEAVRSFLRSHGVRSEAEIATLAYRAGEWPGHLEVRLRDGRTLRAPKFHYNYLIPFFIAGSSLQLADFTNELTDVSVGDAWSPRYESRRGGYSVVLARSAAGVALVEEMRARGLLALEEAPLDEVLDMHGHMLDFKKRGSFIRMSWRDPRPDYGYAPSGITPGRRAVEWCLRLIFAAGRLRAARWAVEHLPLGLVGPVFDGLRRAWKAASKPTKRRGLRERPFVIRDAGATGAAPVAGSPAARA
jgi:coenzyme F420 hydrogenase subunit beta